MDDQILQLIKEKGSTSIDAFNKSKEAFDLLKKVLQQTETKLKNSMASIDARVPVEYEDKGRMEAHLKVANDVLVFVMHTTVFNFDGNHPMMKSSYIKEDASRSMCGMICIYNFLTDSFKFNRVNDSGFLVARIFVNKEYHFLVEGKRNIGLMFNDISNDVIDEKNLTTIIEKALQHALEVDPYVPGFEMMQQTTLQELLNRSGQIFDTGKRFGFVMQSEKKEII